MSPRRAWPRTGVRTRLPVVFRRADVEDFQPTDISGLALWLDGSDANSLYTTDAGAVTAVSSPTEISGCALWLDASDASSITESGGLVSQWNDKSGNARHATSSGSNRPTRTAAAQNGRAVLTFDGTASQMQIDSTFLVTSNATILAVARRTSGSFGAVITSKGTGDTSPALQHSNGSWQINHAGNLSIIGTTAGYAVLSGTISAGATAAYANGLIQDSDASSGTLSSDATKTYIGTYRAAVANVLAGEIAEIIVFNTALSTSDRARVEAYLAQRWGISKVHVQATAASDPVGYWLDKSGNGRHATQSTAANRPSVSVPSGGTEMTNGRRALYSAGSSGNGMGLGNISAAFPNSAGTAFFAYKVSSGGTGTGVDNSYSLAQSRFNNVNSTNTDSGNEGFWRTTRLATYNAAALPRSGFGSSIYTIRSAAGEYTLRSKGAPFYTTATQDWNAGSDYWLWADNANNMTILGGWIGEAIFYNRALSASEVLRIERYLAAKWGITLAPQVSNADAQNWIDRVYANGGTVTSATASAVNTFCNAIDAAGIRDRFYRMGIFAGSNLNAALVPLYRGPSLGGTQYGNATDTNNGPFVSGDYAETGASGGLTGNGTTKYLNTGFAHNLLPQNDSHIACYESQRASTTFKTSIGARSGNTTGNLILGTWNTLSNYTLLAYESASNLGLTSNANGFYVGSVNGASDSALYRNGGSKVTSAETTRTPGSQSLFVFALNDAGTLNVPTDARLCGYSLGLKMTDGQVAAYNTAMQTFQAALGRNV